MPSSSERKWPLVSGALNESDIWRWVGQHDFRGSLFSALQRMAYRKSTIDSGISRARSNHDPVDLDALTIAAVLGQLRSIDRLNTRDAGTLVLAAMALTRAAVSPQVNEVFCNNRKLRAT